MSTPSESLLSEFIDAWAAGHRPDVDAYLERAPEAERDQLAAEIHTYLTHAPAPSLSDHAREQLRAEPLTRAIAQMPSELGMWPTLLPALRRRARLRRDELVARLAAALGAEGAVAKVGRYYHGMESGTLEADGVSQRVLDVLARLLDVSSGELEEAGAFRGHHRGGTRSAFGRTHDAASSELMHLAGAPAAQSLDDAAWDEVDELFLGGR
jgi:hypothetical protein